MKRRLFFFCAIATVTGILIGFLAKEFYWFFLVPLFFIPLVVYRKRIDFIVIILLFTLSAVNSSIGYKEVNTSYDSCYISGLVADVRDGESKAFILSDALIVTPDESYLSIDNIFVTFSGEHLPKSGQRICFHSSVFPYATSAQNVGERSTHTNAIADNIFLRAYSTNFTLLNQETTVKSVIYSLKSTIFDKIFSSTDNKDAAGILYAFLTGDRAYVSSDTFSSFQAAGASHILALSGLHTGIILLILSRLLDLFRASRTIKFILISLFLILFCIFTGFSPSIIRASVIAGVLLFCSAAGFRYDLLNSLSLAATIILLFNPYRLFDVSFLLSFSAVLGIACLPNIHIKNKLLSKLYSSLSVTVGATVFTLPLSLYFFSATSVVSIIFNLIMVPIASLAVFLTVIFIFLPAIFIKVPIFLADLLLRIAKFATLFPLFKMLAFSAIWVALIMLVLFLLSKFVQIRRIYKAAVALLLCASLFAAHFIKDTSTKINVLAGTNELCVHVSTDKNIFIGLDETSTFLKYVNANMHQIDVVVLLNKDDALQFEALRRAGVSFKSVIAPVNTYIDTELDVVLLNNDQPYHVDNLIFCYSSDGLILTFEGKRVLIDGFSLDFDSSVFYLKDLGVCVWDDKLLNTEFYGMITITKNKTKTFCGD